MNSQTRMWRRKDVPEFLCLFSFFIGKDQDLNFALKGERRVVLSRYVITRSD